MQGQNSRGLIVGIGANEILQTITQDGLIVGGQFVKMSRSPLLGPAIENELQFAVQPVGRPIRGDVGTVAPDTSYLLATQRLPNILSGADGSAVEKNATLRCTDLVRDGRRHRGNPEAVAAQHGERGDKDKSQGNP